MQHRPSSIAVGVRSVGKIIGIGVVTAATAATAAATSGVGVGTDTGGLSVEISKVLGVPYYANKRHKKGWSDGDI